MAPSPASVSAWESLPGSSLSCLGHPCRGITGRTIELKTLESIRPSQLSSPSQLLLELFGFLRRPHKFGDMGGNSVCIIRSRAMVHRNRNDNRSADDCEPWGTTAERPITKSACWYFCWYLSCEFCVTFNETKGLWKLVDPAGPTNDFNGLSTLFSRTLFFAARKRHAKARFRVAIKRHFGP